MASVDFVENSKNKKHQHVSQQQLQAAYDTLKKEMGLPLNKDQMDDWDQLIFVVKAAINIKKCKEELSKIKKKEEILLQDSIASDQAMRKRADELFKKREEELSKEYQYEFQLQVQEEAIRAKNKQEQMSKELKDTAAIELESAINVQKAAMATEMIDKFVQLRTESEKTVNDIERTLRAKQIDLNEQESILQENKNLVDVRDQCRAVEAQLMTEMTPGKKWTNQLCSISSLIEVVDRAFSKNDELAKAVVETLPHEVVERGVLTEVSLKKRFEYVERVAQRLALLHNEGPYPGTMYLASYLRSLLTLQSPENPAVQPEGLDGVDNMDLLCRARHCVERGDFARAVKFLDNLKGAPRSVVSGWMQEARLVLQVRNATQVFKNYSTMLIQRSALPVIDH